MKPESEVLSSNIHRVKLGHSGFVNDYQTQSRQTQDKKFMTVSGDHSNL